MKKLSQAAGAAHIEADAERLAYPLEREAIELERLADGDERLLAKVIALRNKAEQIRTTAADRVKSIEIGVPVFSEVHATLEKEGERILREFASLDVNDGRDPQWKARRREELSGEFDRLIEEQRRRGKAVTAEIANQITTMRLNPGDEYDDQRATDLAQAEMISRMRYPAGRLIGEAEAFLSAGNVRQAAVRLDALRLSGQGNTMELHRLEASVEAALDDTLPHRRQARELEAQATQAANRFVQTEATLRTRAARALGQNHRAASASVTAKMAAYSANPNGYVGTADVVGGPESTGDD